MEVDCIRVLEPASGFFNLVMPDQKLMYHFSYLGSVLMKGASIYNTGVYIKPTKHTKVVDPCFSSLSFHTRIMTFL